MKSDMDEDAMRAPSEREMLLGDASGERRLKSSCELMFYYLFDMLDGSGACA